MNISSRPAQAEDIPFLLESMARLYAEDGTAPLVRPEAEAALARLLADASLGRARVLEANGERAGYLIVTFGFSLESHGRIAFVDELFVAGHYRGRGIGTHALRAAERICEETHARALRLEVERANTRALRLYTRCGFREYDRRWMSKRIGERGATP